jgi:hypothetical protein
VTQNLFSSNKIFCSTLQSLNAKYHPPLDRPFYRLQFCNCVEINLYFLPIWFNVSIQSAITSGKNILYTHISRDTQRKKIKIQFISQTRREKKTSKFVNFILESFSIHTTHGGLAPSARNRRHPGLPGHSFSHNQASFAKSSQPQWE